MRFHRHYDQELEKSYGFLANLFLALAKLFLVLFIIFVLAYHPTADQGKISPKAELLMTLTWDARPDADVDSWLKMPDGYIICYKEDDKVSHKEHNLVTLERDDMGKITDSVADHDTEHREEDITWRALVPGDYVMNIHLFRYHVATDENSSVSDNSATVQNSGYDMEGDDVGRPLPKPLHATLVFTQLNPTVRIIKSKNFTFTVARQELYGFRFHIMPNGEVVNVDEDSPISVLKDLVQDSEFVPPDGAF